MPFSNYIYEYYDGISSGNITVGKWVRLLYEYIVKGLQEGLFTHLPTVIFPEEMPS